MFYYPPWLPGAVALLTAISVASGCAGLPGHPLAAPRKDAAQPATPAPTGMAAVVEAAATGAVHASSVPGVMTAATPIEVKAPIIGNNGGSFIHGSVLIPASIISHNGGNIISHNGGNIIGNNGGNVVPTNPADVVDTSGGDIISHNGGNVVSNNGGNIISHNGGNFEIRQVPLAYAAVKLTDAAGSPVKDGSGKPITTTTDADG